MPGIFKLQQWIPDFDPDAQFSTNVRVWKLGREYWTKKQLMSITHALGVLVKVDPKTLDRELGHFARVLVDVDWSGPLDNYVLVERIGHSFYIDVTYENLPKFCSTCHVVGHLHHDCCFSKRRDVISKPSPPLSDSDKAGTDGPFLFGVVLVLIDRSTDPLFHRMLLLLLNILYNLQI